MKVINFGSITGNKLNPNKIKEARMARGMSLAELSKKVGVSSQAISQYEKGETIPNSNIMIKIVDVLDFPVSFFSNNIRNDLDDKVVYFRSNKNLTKKLKKACEIRIGWINQMYSFIENYFELPKINIPELGEIDIDSLDNIKIEEIAMHLRSYWNLGNRPIKNLINTLQKNGLVITKLEIGNKKIDAFSTWNKNVPYIFLGSDKESAVRSRFDLAHELGHLILHKNLDLEDFDNDRETLEHQADIFAGALLLPRESFGQEMITSSIDSLVLLKRKWLVSIAAMIRRCNEIEILTENQIKYLRSQMIKYGYYKKEPMDDSIIPEKPYLFKQAFEILVENNIISREVILETMNINKTEAINLYSLKDDFFDKSDNLLRLIK